MLRAMAWKKPSAELVAAFDAVLPGAPAERRLMFGFPAAFVNGNMFMGLFEESFILRLDGDRKALAKWAKTAFAYGRSLSPKAKKPSKTPARTSAKTPAKKKNTK
jgi:hypothetical protein